MLITPKKGFQLFAFEFQLFQGDHHTAQVNKGRRGFLFRPELDQTHGLPRDSGATVESCRN